MMSLVEMSLPDTVKKQFSFKMRAYIGMFGSLVLMQLVGMFFSFGGTFTTGIGSQGIMVNFSYHSADTIIVFTMIWSFISAILITTKATRYDDFAFVTNRVSSHVSNALFLLAASIAGGVTSVLAGYVMKIILYFYKNIQYGSGTLTIKELAIGFAAAALYVFLFGALGYLTGTLIQISKVFIILLPAAFVGMVTVGAINGKEETLKAVFNFFAAESSPFIFLIKVMVFSAILFTGAAALSNRMEVRK